MEDIIHVFYTCLLQLLKMWFVLWGLMSFEPAKKKYIYPALGGIFSVLLVILGIYRKYNSDVVVSLSTILVIIIICVSFKGNIYKKVLYSLLSYIIIIFLDACIIGIGSVIGIYPIKDNKYYELYNMVCSSVSLILLSIAVFIKKKVVGNNFHIKISRKIYILLFTGSCTGILFIFTIMITLNGKLSDIGRRTMLIISIIIIILYFAACFMIIFISESRDNYKALSLINQRVIESQQQYYTLVNEKQQEIRSIRHEVKNHLACIHGLYQAGKLPELEKYISQLIDSYNISYDLFDTGNDIVNAILNDAQSRYRKEGISIRVEGGFPVKLVIAPTDLCVIFANLIANAVEAIERMENKTENYYIDVRISSYKEDIYIDVNNPVGNNVKVIDGNLVTSKKDNNLHGFGVKNTIQRVKKYQGTYDYKIDNNNFSVEIYMKNKA